MPKKKPWECSHRIAKQIDCLFFVFVSTVFYLLVDQQWPQNNASVEMTKNHFYLPVQFNCIANRLHANVNGRRKKFAGLWINRNRYKYFSPQITGKANNGTRKKDRCKCLFEVDQINWKKLFYALLISS